MPSFTSSTQRYLIRCSLIFAALIYPADIIFTDGLGVGQDPFHLGNGNSGGNGCTVVRSC